MNKASTRKPADDLRPEYDLSQLGHPVRGKYYTRNAVETEIRDEQAKTGRGVKFPLLNSKEPGSLNLTNAEIEDLLA
jgi:hypothetical protein